MSINLDVTRDSRPQTTGDAPDAAAKKKILDLSLTQIVGGALAAMTSAVVGSSLGVAGTIAGAALASVIAGVAGTLYTASLRSGREKVRTVLRTPGAIAAAAPAAVDAATALSSRIGAPVTATGAGATGAAVTPLWTPETPAIPSTRRDRSRSGLPWKRAVGISLAVFALAAVLITSYERVSGEPLSGGTGTTVSHVRSGTSGGSDGDAAPSGSAPSSSSPSSASSSSVEPSAPAGPPSASEPSSGASTAESPATSGDTVPAPQGTGDPAASPTAARPTPAG
jgi:hypothetical protein